MKCLGVGKAILMIIALAILAWVGSWFISDQAGKVLYALVGIAQLGVLILAVLCIFFNKGGELSFS